MSKPVKAQDARALETKYLSANASEGRTDTAPPERWLKADGSTVSCTEKVKVLEENWEEVKALLQDVLDDAVLMGCTEQQVKAEYKRLIDALQCDFKEQKS